MSSDRSVVALAVFIAVVVIAAVVCAGVTARTCTVERFNCRPAIRASWDRGPVAYPDMKCEERCR